MKSTGIVRRVDQLGRIVIPVDLRRALKIKEIEDSIEIYTEEEFAVLKKHDDSDEKTVVTRRVDQLGRIVLPVELRRKLDIEAEKDSLEIFVEDNVLYLKKHQPACVFCGNARNVTSFKGKIVCRQCLNDIKKLK